MAHHKKKSQRDILLQTLLERSLQQILSPLDNFIRKQTTSALFLAIATIIALIFANLPWNNPLVYITEIEVGFLFHNNHFAMSIGEWLNSGLMALFFFILGLEIKRAIMVGELRHPRQVNLILIAAIGGMAVPGLLYSVINYNGTGEHGWAIPMATDTAFAVGILAILAKRISASILVFLAALAIFDDIGAILIIAVFYTEQLQYLALLLALIPFALLVCANKLGVTNGWVYTLFGITLWYYTHESGIHATLAGLLVALTVPAKAYLSQSEFIGKTRSLLNLFEGSNDKNVKMLSSKSQHSLTEEMHEVMKVVSTPLQRWEMLFVNPVNIVILPLFALFNAGIIISADSVIYALGSGVTWGIIVGLVIGKPLGIILFSIISIKLKIGSLPEDVSLGDVVGVGMVAGVGFTMSIFISNLAFEFSPELITSAKFGILLASILSACVALTWLFFYSFRQNRVTV